MKQWIHTESAPKAIGPYQQGWRAGDFLYTSGQLGMDMTTGRLADGVAEQTRMALTNIGAILEEGGLTLADVVKTTVFVRDLGDFQTVNAVYATFFADAYPARSCVEVARLPMDALVEIEAVAYRG